MEGAQEALRSCLIADLSQLALEAKRPESLAGQLTGWISGPEHPAVKDAAEKTIRDLSEPSWAETLADNEVSNLSHLHGPFRPGKSCQMYE